MKYTNFINYSTYSGGHGLLKIEDIIKINLENNSSSAVITDHMTCMGFPEFDDACQKNNLKPIFGLSVDIEGEVGNLILIAKNQNGISSLKNIVSLKKTTSNAQSFSTWEDISNNVNNCFVINGNPSSITGQAFQSNKAEEKIKQINNYTKGNNNSFILDIQDISSSLSQEILSIGKKNNIAVISTSNNRVMRQNHIPLLKEKALSLLPIKKRTISSFEDIGIFDNDFAKKSSYQSEMMGNSIGDLYIHRTTQLASKIENTTVFKEPSFPTTNKLVLRDMVRDSWNEFKEDIPFARRKVYEKRIIDELKIIEDLKFEDYFKTFQLAAEYARKNDIAYTIRGSGTSSLVVRLLGISQIDPIKHELLFERFLNYKRAKAGSLPDLDFDTSNPKKIATFLAGIFGNDNIATLTNLNTIRNYDSSLMLAKNAYINHLSGVNKDNILKTYNKITDSITNSFKKGTLSDELLKNWRLKKMYNEEREVKFLVDAALTLEGQITNHKRNGSSLIVSSNNIKDNLSVSQDSYALVDNVAEISKVFAERVGFIKLDILSNKFIGKNLDVYKELGIQENLNKEDYSDKKVYELFQGGHTFSLFQMTSIGSKLAKEMQPKKFTDIVILLGLIRPGVPRSEINSFIKTKNENLPLNSPSKELNEILKDSYGIIIFEEQLMKISQEIGGFSADESDELRRTIKNKDRGKMLKIRGHFVSRGQEKHPNYDTSLLNEIFDSIEAKIDGYMFNQAHAKNYSKVCYHQAFIKANFPAEYKKHFIEKNKTVEYMNELLSRGVYLSPPNINKSTKGFRTIPPSSFNDRVGFTTPIDNLVGGDFSELIINERFKEKFTGVFNFTERMINKIYEKEGISFFDGENEKTKLIKKDFLSKTESLIMTGFFDEFSLEGDEKGRLEFRLSASESLSVAVELAMNPYIKGDFTIKKSSNLVSVDKIKEIEMNAFGFSALAFEKLNKPMEIVVEEKKNKKRGSLYDLI